MKYFLKETGQICFIDFAIKVFIHYSKRIFDLKLYNENKLFY